jgi:hypothetical protein
MMEWVLNFIWTTVPLWVWIIIGGVLLGGAWRTFGWQGVLGGLLSLLTLGAYRQGYRDAHSRRPPVVPIEPYKPPAPQPAPRPRRRTLMDILNGR